MSLQAFGWAWGQETGSPTRKAVLLSLANAHNGDTGRCDPGIALICRDTELGTTAVKNALRELCEGEHAIIGRERKRRKDGSLGTYAYTFPGHLLRTRDAPSLETPDVPRPETPGVSLNQEVLNQGETRAKALASRAPATSYDPRKGTKLTGRNQPWDALVEVTGADEKVEAGQLSRALKLIRGYAADTLSSQAAEDPGTGEFAIAQQIRARARLYRQRWPDMELTPTALAKHWSRVLGPPPGGDVTSTIEAAQRGLDAARGGTAA